MMEWNFGYDLLILDFCGVKKSNNQQQRSSRDKCDKIRQTNADVSPALLWQNSELCRPTLSHHVFFWFFPFHHETQKKKVIQIHHEKYNMMRSTVNIPKFFKERGEGWKFKRKLLTTEATNYFSTSKQRISTIFQAWTPSKNITPICEQGDK